MNNRDSWKYPQYQAYITASKSQSDQDARMELVPDDIKGRVLRHMETVKLIKNEHQMRERRR